MFSCVCTLDLNHSPSVLSGPFPPPLWVSLAFQGSGAALGFNDKTGWGMKAFIPPFQKWTFLKKQRVKFNQFLLPRRTRKPFIKETCFGRKTAAGSGASRSLPRWPSQAVVGKGGVTSCLQGGTVQKPPVVMSCRSPGRLPEWRLPRRSRQRWTWKVSCGCTFRGLLCPV